MAVKARKIMFQSLAGVAFASLFIAISCGQAEFGEKPGNPGAQDLNPNPGGPADESPIEQPTQVDSDTLDVDPNDPGTQNPSDQGPNGPVNPFPFAGTAPDTEPVNTLPVGDGGVLPGLAPIADQYPGLNPQNPGYNQLPGNMPYPGGIQNPGMLQNPGAYPYGPNSGAFIPPMNQFGGAPGFISPYGYPDGFDGYYIPGVNYPAFGQPGIVTPSNSYLGLYPYGGNIGFDFQNNFWSPNVRQMFPYGAGIPGQTPYVTLDVSPVVVPTYPNAGSQVLFGGSCQGFNGQAAMLWDLGNGTQLNGLGQQSYFTQPGTYVVQGICQGSYGQSFAQAIQVIVYDPLVLPQVSMGNWQSPLNGCLGTGKSSPSQVSQVCY